MTFRIPTFVLPLAMIVCGALLAGCTGSQRSAADSGAPSAPPEAAGTAPPFNLAGRWTLSSAWDRVMRDDVRRRPGRDRGHHRARGGCPFSFFTSRKWTYSTAGLAIRDHHAQVLAQLAPAGSNRFEGKTSAGQDVALSR